MRHLPRTVGASGYTLRKLITHAANMMTGFSTLPLQVASIIGFALVLMGVLILTVVLGNYLIRGNEVPGFASLACMIVIFSGAQLFSLGVIGEYLARMHFRSMDRPVVCRRGNDGRCAGCLTQLSSEFRAPVWNWPSIWPRGTARRSAAKAQSLQRFTFATRALAAHDLNAFRDWCRVNNVVLVTARLEHHCLAEAGLLEAHGFRFIELNYRPFIQDLSVFAPDPAILVRTAERGDAAAIIEIARQIFEAGRFHMDPAIGPEIGNRRYALWAERAFDNPANRS